MRTSHGLKWENKTYKVKRSVALANNQLDRKYDDDVLVHVSSKLKVNKERTSLRNLNFSTNTQ